MWLQAEWQRQWDRQEWPWWLASVSASIARRGRHQKGRCCHLQLLCRRVCSWFDMCGPAVATPALLRRYHRQRESCGKARRGPSCTTSLARGQRFRDAVSEWWHWVVAAPPRPAVATSTQAPRRRSGCPGGSIRAPLAILRVPRIQASLSRTKTRLLAIPIARSRFGADHVRMTSPHAGTHARLNKAPAQLRRGGCRAGRALSTRRRRGHIQEGSSMPLVYFVSLELFHLACGLVYLRSLALFFVTEFILRVLFLPAILRGSMRLRACSDL